VRVTDGGDEDRAGARDDAAGGGRRVDSEGPPRRVRDDKRPTGAGGRHARGRERSAGGRRALVRRRRARLAAGAAAAFAAGLALAAATGDGPSDPASGRPAGAPDDVSAGAAPASRARAAVDGLTLDQQVGQTLVLRFAGTSPPGYVRRALRERRTAGVILFRDNVVSSGQLRELTRALRAAGGRPLIAVDQEGGDVRILPWAPPAANAPDQAGAGTVGSDARAAARALRAAGVTVSLAPVADVPTVAGAALAGRSFSHDPEEAAAAVQAAVEGWRAGGVGATAKHFPGLGAAQVNTDDGPATVIRSGRRLAAIDLVPFRAAVRAGVPLVMVAHARYPGIDARRIASQSPAVMALLREDLGFRGVVVTDSMEAAASLATGSVAAASERALRAGADLLLLTGRGSYAPVRRRLLAAARRSPALRARVREAAARVLALKAAPARPPA
jgi:beta-N-acetylhexosaminidase